jgi:hypothetical protein
MLLIVSLFRCENKDCHCKDINFLAFSAIFVIECLTAEGLHSGMSPLIGNRLEKPDFHNRSVNDLR